MKDFKEIGLSNFIDVYHSELKKEMDNSDFVLVLIGFRFLNFLVDINLIHIEKYEKEEKESKFSCYKISGLINCIIVDVVAP